MVNQRETAEEESKQGKTHDECKGVRDGEHVHAVLLHLILSELDVVLEKILAHKADGAHKPD